MKKDTNIERIEKAKARYNELKPFVKRHIAYAILCVAGALGCGELHDRLHGYKVGNSPLNYGTFFGLLSIILALSLFLQISYFMELFVTKTTSEGNYYALPLVADERDIDDKKE